MILIIDDELDICAILKEAFQFEGYEADYATSAEAALDKLNAKSYKLLLIDVKLGGEITGIDIIRSCQALSYAPFVIVISALPKSSLEDILKREGLHNVIDKVLEKPADLRPDILLHIVKEYL